MGGKTFADYLRNTPLVLYLGLSLSKLRDLHFRAVWKLVYFILLHIFVCLTYGIVHILHSTYAQFALKVKISVITGKHMPWIWNLKSFLSC